MRVVGKAALAKHRESCGQCRGDHACEVAQVHLGTLARLRKNAAA